MFKKMIKCCIIVYMLVACSATMANPHIEAEHQNFNKNVSNDLVFYVLGNASDFDKEFAVPAVLRYFFTPEGMRVQLMHVNQASAESDTKTLWFQNDKHQEKNAPKKGESRPQAKQEEVKSKTRTL